MSNRVDPLTWNVALTTPGGLPTPEFQRKWVQLQNLVLKVSSGQVVVGSTSGTPAAATMSGDATIDAAGAVTVASYSGGTTFGTAAHAATTDFDAAGAAAAAQTAAESYADGLAPNYDAAGAAATAQTNAEAYADSTFVPATGGTFSGTVYTALSAFSGANDDAFFGSFSGQLANGDTSQYTGMHASFTGAYVVSGQTFSGYLNGCRTDALINNASHAGTIGKAFGFWSRTGIAACVAGGTITTAAALYAEILNNDVNGTITNAYALYSPTVSTTGTTTNLYGVYIQDSTAENYFGGSIRTNPRTVANLSAISARDGARSFVTDATATTFASAVVGGGTNHVPVYYDGGTSTWRIG